MFFACSRSTSTSTHWSEPGASASPRRSRKFFLDQLPLAFGQSARRPCLSRHLFSRHLFADPCTLHRVQEGGSVYREGGEDLHRPVVRAVGGHEHIVAWASSSPRTAGFAERGFGGLYSDVLFGVVRSLDHVPGAAGSPVAVEGDGCRGACLPPLPPFFPPPFFPPPLPGKGAYTTPFPGTMRGGISCDASSSPLGKTRTASRISASFSSGASLSAETSLSLST